jgi:hypothetical protein
MRPAAWSAPDGRTQRLDVPLGLSHSLSGDADLAVRVGRVLDLSPIADAARPGINHPVRDLPAVGGADRSPTRFCRRNDRLTPLNQSLSNTLCHPVSSRLVQRSWICVTQMHQAGQRRRGKLTRR